MTLHHFRALTDLALAGKEDEDIAIRIEVRHKIDPTEHMLPQRLAALPGWEKNVLHREGPSLDLHHRTIPEELRKATRIQRSR